MLYAQQRVSRGQHRANSLSKRRASFPPEARRSGPDPKRSRVELLVVEESEGSKLDARPRCHQRGMGRIDKGGVWSKSCPAIRGSIVVLEYPSFVCSHVRGIVPAMRGIERHVINLSRAIRVKKIYRKEVSLVARRRIAYRKRAVSQRFDDRPPEVNSRHSLTWHVSLTDDGASSRLRRLAAEVSVDVEDRAFDITRGQHLRRPTRASDVVVEHNDIGRARCGPNEIGCFRVAYATQFVLIIETMHGTPMTQAARDFHLEPKRLLRLWHVTHLDYMLRQLNVGFLCSVWRG